MGKKILIDCQSATALGDPRTVVDLAGDWAEKLTNMASRRPGDTPNAMRSIERGYGVGYSVLWGLRYRRGRIKDVAASVFFRLRAAYEAECSKQMRKLEHEIYVAKQIAGPSHAAVGKAETTLGNLRKARRVPPNVPTAQVRRAHDLDRRKR